MEVIGVSQFTMGQDLDRITHSDFQLPVGDGLSPPLAESCSWGVRWHGRLHRYSREVRLPVPKTQRNRESEAGRRFPVSLVAAHLIGPGTVRLRRPELPAGGRKKGGTTGRPAVVGRLRDEKPAADGR